jgi:hypothetical protein
MLRDKAHNRRKLKRQADEEGLLAKRLGLRGEERREKRKRWE